jgi:hypothetical protein
VLVQRAEIGLTPIGERSRGGLAFGVIVGGVDGLKQGCKTAILSRGAGARRSHSPDGAAADMSMGAGDMSASERVWMAKGRSTKNSAVKGPGARDSG